MNLASAALLFVNETLTASIAIIAVSLLLFNLTRNLRNRVAKSSAVALACVSIAYVADAFISLEPDFAAHEIASRLQWLGIAFIPAAMYHLSDALLATTGLPSRGRRRRLIRLLYLIGAGFLLAAAFADALFLFARAGGLPSIQAGSLFPVYCVYFVAANGFAFYNVQRARKRCLTHGTRRRMAFLQTAFLTPALGIFPYSVLLSPGDEFSVFGLLVINTANVIIILMLFFLSYPLYFFGSDIPNRLVKKQLLDFLLRGPATGLIALAVINFTAQATRILGLPGEAFTPPAVVVAVLLWQWFVSLALPYFELMFIYRDEDGAQITMLQSLGERVLTRGDLSQLIAAITESICDYMRIDEACVILVEHDSWEMLNQVGQAGFSEADLLADQEFSQALAQAPAQGASRSVVRWRDYALIPLYSSRMPADESPSRVIGLFALPDSENTLHERLHDPESSLSAYLTRLETSLEDMRLQLEMFSLLEGLLPQFQMTRSRAVQVEYRQAQPQLAAATSLPDQQELFEQVRAALRHYWGGAGISQSNLINLRIVQARMSADQDTAVNALRKTLQDCIATLKPDGERKLASPEWTLYNILQLRFLERKKVRDVARRLSMSEADLYRKQRVAILAVSDLLLQREKQALG